MMWTFIRVGYYYMRDAGQTLLKSCQSEEFPL